MCNETCGYNSGLRQFRRFQRYFRALHCPVRWMIIRLLGERELSTGEIFTSLMKVGENISKSGLYYHLSELEEAGIIELAKYREVGGGAPEKVWRLKVREIKIDLTEEL